MTFKISHQSLCINTNHGEDEHCLCRSDGVAKTKTKAKLAIYMYMYILEFHCNHLYHNLCNQMPKKRMENFLRHYYRNFFSH